MSVTALRAGAGMSRASCAYRCASQIDLVCVGRPFATPLSHWPAKPGACPCHCAIAYCDVHWAYVVLWLSPHSILTSLEPADLNDDLTGLSECGPCRPMMFVRFRHRLRDKCYSIYRGPILPRPHPHGTCARGEFGCPCRSRPCSAAASRPIARLQPFVPCGMVLYATVCAAVTHCIARSLCSSCDAKGTHAVGADCRRTQQPLHSLPVRFASAARQRAPMCRGTHATRIPSDMYPMQRGNHPAALTVRLSLGTSKRFTRTRISRSIR